MREETYEYLYDNAILLAAKDVMKSIPNELAQKYNLSYEQNYIDKKELIFREYEFQKNTIRKRYFYTGDKDENLIDTHKICACFTAALLKVRIFDYKKTIMPVEPIIFYSNYMLAFLTGIHIMYLSLLSDLQNKKDKKMYTKLLEQRTFLFPKTNIGHDEYLQGRIKTLALNDMYGVDFDLLTYADMLFWIEKYNLDCLQKKIDEES